MRSDKTVPSQTSKRKNLVLSLAFCVLALLIAVLVLWGPGRALRQAAARRLPAANAARKKLGFPVPVRDWLRQEPYTSRVRAAFARPAAAQFFRPQVLHSMLNRHLHGGDCWRQIWCVYSFLIWYEQFFGA